MCYKCINILVHIKCNVSSRVQFGGGSVMFWGEICFNGRTRVDPHTCEIYEMELLSYIIYQGTDILPEIFSSSPDTRVFVAKKITRGRQTRVLDCKKKFLAIYI
jgi:hypothetical protein